MLTIFNGRLASLNGSRRKSISYFFAPLRRRITGAARMAVASAVRPTQRIESARVCKKFATPVARMVRGATNTLSSDRNSKPSSKHWRATVDFPAPLGPINSTPRSPIPTQAACSDTRRCTRAASVNTANSISSYRMWYGYVIIAGLTTTRAVRSRGDKTTKLEVPVAPPSRFPALTKASGAGSSRLTLGGRSLNRILIRRSGIRAARR
jgi:hypothetical protein